MFCLPPAAVAPVPVLMQLGRGWWGCAVGSWALPQAPSPLPGHAAAFCQPWALGELPWYLPQDLGAVCSRSRSLLVPLLLPRAGLGCCTGSCAHAAGRVVLHAVEVGVGCVLRTRTRPHQGVQPYPATLLLALCNPVMVPAAVQAVGATRGTSSRREGLAAARRGDADQR